MKKTIIYTALATLFVCCSGVQECPEGINLLPMYGHAKKCKQQLDADQAFINWCKEEMGDLKDAAKTHINWGNDYYKNKDYETAMKRYNQAWLLDSLNSDVYCGFGLLQIEAKKTDEARELLNRSIILDPKNAKAWRSLAITDWMKFDEQLKATRRIEIDRLNTMIEHLKKAISISPQDDLSFYYLTFAYSHFNQKDSARKYMKITDGLNPNLINIQLRESIQ